MSAPNNALDPRWILLLMLGMTPPMLAAQDATTQSAGGTGGDPYTIGCGSKVLVGVQGRSKPAGLVGVIQALCIDLNADGTWIGSPALAPGVAGINNAGDRFAALTCPRDQAVSAISGNATQTIAYVATLQISCAALGPYGHLVGSSTAVATGIGGGLADSFANGFTLNPSTPFGPFACPDNKPGKAFTGRAHDWIDQIALVCNYPSVAGAAVKSIAVSATSLIGGNVLNGTVTLNAVAPPNGSRVTLSAGSPLFGTFQTNPITVAAGQTTAFFVLNTNPVVVAANAAVTASPNVGSPSAAVTIQPPVLKALTVRANGGAPGNGFGSVELTGKAFDGGLPVELASGNPAIAGVPASVLVPGGQTSVQFSVATGSMFSGAVSPTTSACTYVTATYNGVQRNAQVAAVPPNTGAFHLAGASSSPTITVTFSTTSPAARTLSLVSSNIKLVRIPASIEVSGRATSASFTMDVVGVAHGPSCVVITATDGSGSASSLVVSLNGAMVVSASGG